MMQDLFLSLTAALLQCAQCCHRWMEAILRQYCWLKYAYNIVRLWDVLIPDLYVLFFGNYWEHRVDPGHAGYWFSSFYLSLAFLTDVLGVHLPTVPRLWSLSLLASVLLPSSSVLSPHVLSFPPLLVSLHIYFSVASSQANNQLINQLSPRIIVSALRGAL